VVGGIEKARRGHGRDRRGNARRACVRASSPTVDRQCRVP
jgi:hypothetical protein